MPVWKTKPLVTYAWIQIRGGDDDVNLADYKDILLLQRFANPNIKDSVGRICSQAPNSTKFF
jgi:mannitol-1-phosphate/altronate dehydrogenase